MLSARRSRALQKLILVTQENKIGLLAVQEVKCLGRSITEKKDYKICYSCDDQMFLEHALLLVNAYDQELLILNLLIGECVLRIRSKFENIASSVPVHQRRIRVEERKISFLRA